jgi:hypothetical protein
VDNQYYPELVAEDLGRAAQQVAHHREERREGAELLSERLGYRRQRRPYQTTQPELDHYADAGCPISPKCINCPRFRCIEEESKQVRKSILAEYKKGPR